ncbi:DUF948 domain-containing protein [Limosilactobacillus reuteri]|uniref:DUF948 domain-containing protein n=1 Tax=Limosilactobacillus reuteri TaxID=1598 RepID=UPI001E46FE20|nr:DUF948 domain-containing protein [Limosilactobacillus reuteri]MCC4501824.1 hypothetical protein [Limosilactobacillus reuteri]
MNLFLTAASEWTGLGLTAADWCAVLALVGSLIATLIKLIKVMNNLTISIDELNESNRKRDRAIDELTKHVQQHDEQFIRDEARLNQIAKQLEGSRKQ